jgi:hypothetical protein
MQGSLTAHVDPAIVAWTVCVVVFFLAVLAGFEIERLPRAVVWWKRRHCRRAGHVIVRGLCMTCVRRAQREYMETEL